MMNNYGKVWFIGLTLVVITLTLETIFTVSPIHAAGPWYVTADGDNGNDCLSPTTACATINGAIGKANSGDTIYVGIGTYTSTGSAVVWLNKSITLSGGWEWNGTQAWQSGTSIIDGESVRRGMAVANGVNVIVEHFVFQNGFAYSGAGIENAGSLILTESTINNNTASFQAGGLLNGIGAVMTLNNSTVSNNTADSSGGGILNSGGNLAINNSTITGNKANGPGGGIYENHGTLTLNSSTLSGNLASRGGGIYLGGGTVTLQNSILAGNHNLPGPSDYYSPDCYGSADSMGYNLVGDTSGCAFTASVGDLTNLKANLSPLIGSPAYHPLRLGSPAIDAGDPAGCYDNLGDLLTTDQRGVTRPLDGDSDNNAICDIGAYELDPNNPPIQVFLPAIFHHYCPDFFDDFSRLTSGWPVADDAFGQLAYLGGEYRIFNKQSDFFFRPGAPTCDRENYVVAVDARWAGMPGNSYGLIFGVTSGFERYYLFHINTDFQMYQLLRRNSDGSFVEIVPRSSAAVINPGSATNHLKVTRNGQQIILTVNNTILLTLASESSILGPTGVGLMSSSYNYNPTSDARFDNFSVISLPSSNTARQQTAETVTKTESLDIIELQHELAPANIGW